MTMKSTPLSSQLQAWAAAQSLTPYRISQMISAETDPTETERKRIEQRWFRVLRGDNFRLQDVESDLAWLGVHLQLVDHQPHTGDLK